MQQLASMTWLWLAGGWVLIVIGALLLFWGLFFDRARGRRRCPKCWYDLSATPGLTCPECGRTARGERALQRTRRRRWAAPAAMILVAAGYAATLAPTAITKGWRQAVPSSVLVFVAPVEGSAWTWQRALAGRPRYGLPADGFLAELLGRAKGRRIASWQWKVFLDRLHTAQPDQFEYMVQARTLWPRGVPVEVGLRSPVLIGTDDDLVLRVRIKGSGREWVQRNLSYQYGGPEVEDPVLLGPPPEGVDRFEIEVELLAGATLVVDRNHRFGKHVDPSTARRIWRGVVATSGVAESADEILTPFTSAVADRAIGDHIRPILVRDMANARMLLKVHPAGYHLGKDGEDWALGLKAEVLREGRVVAWAEVLDLMPEPGVVTHPGPYSDIELHWSEPAPDAEQLAEELWELRLRGEPGIALRDLRRKSYWAGTIQSRIRDIEPLSDGFTRQRNRGR